MHTPGCTVRPHLDELDIEVWRRVAVGQTDREIAASLGYSRIWASKRVAKLRDHLRLCAPEHRARNRVHLSRLYSLWLRQAAAGVAQG